jgi:hypothetical protein
VLLKQTILKGFSLGATYDGENISRISFEKVFLSMLLEWLVCPKNGITTPLEGEPLLFKKTCTIGHMRFFYTDFQ